MGGKVLELESERLLREGCAEGVEKGQNLLVEAVERLRNGETPEQLLASGIDQETIDCALSALSIK